MLDYFRNKWDIVTTQVVSFKPARPDYIGTGGVHSSGVQLGVMNHCPAKPPQPAHEKPAFNG